MSFVRLFRWAPNARLLTRRPLRLPATFANSVLCALLLGVVACQDDPGAAPELAATKVNRYLTVTGGGTGGGIVTAPAYGETAGFECVITNGTAAPESCIMPVEYGWKTQVILTATPDPGGSRFTGWSGACTGTGSCSVTMASTQTVNATFRKITGKH